MIISHGELVTDTVGAVWRVGVPKASWEKGLERVKGKWKKASLRKQHLWWNLIVAYALVKLTKEEEETLPSGGKLCKDLKLWQAWRVWENSKSWIDFWKHKVYKREGQQLSVKSIHMVRCPFMKCYMLPAILKVAESYCRIFSRSDVIRFLM